MTHEPVTKEALRRMRRLASDAAVDVNTVDRLCDAVFALADEVERAWDLIDWDQPR